MKKNRAKILLPLLIAAVAAGVMLRYWIFKPRFRYAGTVEATQIDLSARLSSVIAEILITEGQHVEKDQVLVTLACEDVKITADLNADTFTRMERLYRSGAAPKEQYDQALYKKRDSDVRLSWCTIRAPLSGTVLTRYEEPGEWVNPGTKLLSLADLREAWTYIYVPQDEIFRIKVGQSVQGVLPEAGGRSFVGTIRKINGEAEFTPKNVQTQAERTRLVFGVKVGFANPDETLKPGMTIEISLPPDSQQSAK